MLVKTEEQKEIKNKDTKELESKLIDLTRVMRMTAGGRRFRFRAAVIVGNRNGMVGFGLAKGADVAQAVEKATRKAKKNLIKVLIVNETIPHQVEAKFGAAKVLLKPQKKGKGLVAGGTVRIVCDLAGIKNISSKIIGRTSNKINNARATLKALQSLRPVTSLRKENEKDNKKEEELRIEKNRV